MSKYIAATIAIILLPIQAMAHSDNAAAPASLWQAYTLDTEVIVPMLLFASLYLIGLGRIWSRAGWNRGVQLWRVCCFIAAMLALMLAMIWPFDALGGFSLAAHMSQHVLLTTFAAPLLVLSAPLATLLWALPLSWRRHLGTIGQNSVIRRGWHVFTLPLFAWLAYASCLWLWHMPALYEAAIINDHLHLFEHVSFFASALLLWWTALISAYSTAFGLGTGVFLLFTTSLHSGLLGALLTFAQRPFYQFYETTRSPFVLEPLADQQLAGIIMWIPGGLIYLAGAVFLTCLWLQRLQKRNLMRQSADVDAEVDRDAGAVI